MTIRIGYVSDDDDFEEDPDELRERAFKLWQNHKNPARCNSRHLRLARDYALDLGFYPAARAITSELESRGISY